MSRFISPEEKQLLIAGYVLNTLDEQEADKLSELLAEDAGVQQEIDRTQQLLEQTYGVSHKQPPAHLRARVLSTFNQAAAAEVDKRLLPAQSQLTSAIATTSQVPSTQAIWRWFRVGVVSLIVVLGLGNYVLWRALQQELATPNNQVTPSTPYPLTYRLKETAKGRIGTAVIQVNPQTLEASIEVDGLPELAPDETYALWTVLKPDAPFTTDSKNAILVEAFEVDSTGSAYRKLTVPTVFQEPEAVMALGITVESADAPQAHRGTPVLLWSL